MPVDLVIAPEAEVDIAEAYIWYEGRRAGLGEEFLFRRKGYRRALTRRFPYAVFYETSGETVTVYAVFHTSRGPDKWRQRLL